MEQVPTPDTMNYLLLGLTAVTILGVLFIGSLVLRYRSYQQDIKTIEQLQSEQ